MAFDMLDNFSSIVSNALAVGGGLILGFIIRDCLFSKNTNKKSREGQSNTFEEESFSDLGDCEHKLVLVVQNGLKMGKGKIAAQCSHASVMAYSNCQKMNPALLKEWLNSGQRKVVVKVDDEKTLLETAHSARKQGLIVSMVCDAGKTQIPSGSKTVVGVGPGPNYLLDSVTGHLKLL